MVVLKAEFWLRLAQILKALIPQSDWKLSIKT